MVIHSGFITGSLFASFRLQAGFLHFVKQSTVAYARGTSRQAAMPPIGFEHLNMILRSSCLTAFWVTLFSGMTPLDGISALK